MKVMHVSANLPLAQDICDKLDMKLVQSDVSYFNDREVKLEINENVRGEDVFVVQPTSSPANDNIMELLIAIDALRRGSARRITAVIPYFGYARQDRKSSPRSPISARLVANLIERAGADRVLTMDLHAGQIQGFFDRPTDNLYAQPLIWRDIQQTYAKKEGDVMIVSPDVGGVVRARRVAKLLDVELGIVDKRRPRVNESVVMNVIGDVSGKHCVLVDDIVDTAGTLCNAAEALFERGASSVAAYCTHGVLSDPAVERITTSVLSELVVTNTIKPRADVNKCDKIRIINVAPMFAEAMRRITNEESVSTLFDDN